MLVVNDFGLNYIEKQCALHLLNILMNNSIVSKDQQGELYCGVTLK